ncbi:MAG: hypothetical protein V3W41_14700 [Planctomycetota bacterium]
MAFVTMDDKDLKRFERDLKQFRIRAYPFATKDTVNRSALMGQKEARKEIEKRMILRNSRTLGGIRVELERRLQVNKQHAVVGSIDPWMEGQEFGRTDRKGGKVGVPIPTGAATGEGENVQVRRRLPTRANAVRNIELDKRKRGRRFGRRVTNRRQKNKLTVIQAIRTKRKYAYMDLGSVKGIFRITGRVSRRGGGVTGVRIKRVINLSNRTVVIPANPWLRPAVDRVQKRMPGIYRKALKQQLIRHRLFRPK